MAGFFVLSLASERLICTIASRLRQSSAPASASRLAGKLAPIIARTSARLNLLSSRMRAIPRGSQLRAMFSCVHSSQLFPIAFLRAGQNTSRGGGAP